jgi:hypothetical protein
MSVTGMFGQNGRINLWVDRGVVVNGGWDVYHHEDTDEVSCGKDGERAQRICMVYSVYEKGDYNDVIDAHQKVVDEGRVEVMNKLYQMQYRHMDVWSHFKQCDLCKTRPSWPSTVCSEMARLQGLELDSMKDTANELR